MRTEILTSCPDNNRIYSLLEPIAITKSKKIISGHRKFSVMRNLGCYKCEIRYIELAKEIIALIENNRHRQKTTSDILNKARFLEKDIKITCF